jgi:hypothetical protein
MFASERSVSAIRTVENRDASAASYFFRDCPFDGVGELVPHRVAPLQIIRNSSSRDNWAEDRRTRGVVRPRCGRRSPGLGRDAWTPMMNAVNEDASARLPRPYRRDFRADSVQKTGCSTEASNFYRLFRSRRRAPSVRPAVRWRRRCGCPCWRRDSCEPHHGWRRSPRPGERHP